MKKLITGISAWLLCLSPLGMQAQSVVTKDLYEGTQVLNSDFEDFHAVKGSSKGYVEPDYWHSFATVQGALASYTGQDLEEYDEARPNSNGHSCVAVRTASLKVLFFTVTANGTLTTGRMNAGSATASDPANHAFSIVSNVTDDDGFPFYTKLTERPSAISVWLKFTPKSGTPKATLSAVITNGEHYQEPQDKDYTNVIVGEARNAAIDATNGWQRLELPFNYDDFNGGDPQAIMVTLSTNATPGGGTPGDELLIDDLELIYTQTVTIPESGFATMTNVAMTNHKVVVPEGLKAYTLGLGEGRMPIVTATYEAGSVLPAEAAVLLQGEPGDYTFRTTLYDAPATLPAAADLCLVKGSEGKDPQDGFRYYQFSSQASSLGFTPVTDGASVADDEALLRVAADKAAEAYPYIVVPASPVGDINADGQVSIADVTALVNKLLGKGQESFLQPSADVNGDGQVSIADVTALVNILLGKQ